MVRRYLEALESRRPRRGRKRTAESITNRLAAIDERLASADPLSRLHLVQERIDLQRELAGTEGDGIDLEELEAAFTQVAAAYGERKALTYEAWRSIGHRAPGLEGQLGSDAASRGAKPTKVRLWHAAAANKRRR